jgi:N4-gp56 family major capsid protein
MALMTTGSAGISPTYQTYFSKVLLKHAIALLVMNQLGQQKDLPKNKGAKTIRFFRPAAADRTKVLGPADTGGAGAGSKYGFLAQLAEGDPTQAVASANQREITWTPIDLTLDNFGEPSKFSDLLDETDLFGTLEDISRLMGEDAASAADWYITQKIVPGLPTSSKRYARGLADYAATKAATVANATLQIQDLLGAMTRLTITRAPKPNGGSYIAAMPPQVSFDIKLDQKFIDCGVRGTYRGLFNGEVGTWYGVRILEHTQPQIENATEEVYDGNIVSGGSSATNTSIFTTICTGAESFGFPILGPGSPWSPKMIINDRPDSGNPLGQFTTVGWKAYWCCGRLNDAWLVALRSKVSYQ